MIVNIPVRSLTDAYSFSMLLSGDVFEFLLRFNGNEQKWYMTVLRSDAIVLAGVKLVHSEDLLAQFIAYDIPQGTLSIHDKDGNYADPNDLNFGESVFLRYEE
jgi:hypothetical protein